MKKSTTVGFCNGHFKIILIVLLLFGIIVPLFIQVMLQLQQGSLKDDVMLESHKILYVDIEQKRLQVETLESHLNELETIRIKALNELLRLDEQRVHLQTNIQVQKEEKSNLVKEIKSFNKEIQKLKKQAEFNLDRKPQKIVQNIIHVGIPKKHLPKDDVAVVQVTNHTFPPNIQCSYHSCIDYSSCSILKEFTFYIYKPSSHPVLEMLYESLTKLTASTNDMIKSCFYIVLLSFDNQETSTINQYLESLPSWKGSGVNHIVVIESSKKNTFCDKIKFLSKGKSILVLQENCVEYDSSFDFLSPLVLADSHEGYWKYAPTLLPIQRKYLVMFFSEYVKQMNKHKNLLEDLEDLKSENNFFIETSCKGQFLYNCPNGWCPCSNDRETKLKASTYSIIIANEQSYHFFSELIECLKNGVIPIVVGDHSLLPFSNLLDWTQVCLLLHSQRLTELQYVIQTMPLEDAVSIKRQGRFFYETYFSSKDIFFNTILAAIRHNIGLPPSVIQDAKATFITDLSYSPDTSEFMGVKIPAKLFNHNFSYIGQNTHKLWNTFPGALQMYPVVTWNNPVPSEVQFSNEGKDSYTPIGDGKGGDGVAFSRALGGDYPLEQFTVLLLTYDRPSILMEALQRLSGMKYLNKVLVLWNHPVDPTKDISWPDIGVQIEVIRTGRNSLNNRFVPYDAIETEAILSVDDDVYLRHDEIELAFRVWRENRDRLVGFPGRHHSYNSTTNSFYYNPEHSCELSLVLTGAAFFHKYYSYIYTYKMHPSIRQLVDEYMNCEDIAVNFLIAHMTQKPPIKVTSRWTFRCPGCPVALSAVSDHYEERNKCMAYFQKVYGYNPLRRTQYRADSILFKTRIPSTMKKCFQYV